MVDYQTQLYDMLYRLVSQGGFGVAAELVTPAADHKDLVVIDKTAGVSLDFGDAQGHVRGGVQVQTIRPAAAVRAKELVDKGLAAADLPRSQITFNGQTWRVISYLLQPSPNGEADGQVLLVLSDEGLAP